MLIWQHTVRQCKQANNMLAKDKDNGDLNPLIMVIHESLELQHQHKDIIYCSSIVQSPFLCTLIRTSTNLEVNASSIQALIIKLRLLPLST